MLSAPKAPDPYATAAAQGTVNKQTAISQQLLNSMDQTTPDGSLTYSENGAWSDGTPKIGVTQSLSPTNQYLYDTNQGTQVNLANIGRQQSGQIGQTLATPFDMSQSAIDGQTAGMPALPSYRAGATPGAQPSSWNSDPAWSGAVGDNMHLMNTLAGLPGSDVPQTRDFQTRDFQTRYTDDPERVAIRHIGSNDQLEDQLYKSAFTRFQPQLDQQRQGMEADLANRGLKPGSTGYDNAVQGFDNSVNDLRSKTFLDGQQQAFGQSAARAQNDFSQDLSSQGQYYSQKLAQNNQNFDQDMQHSAQMFGQDAQRSNQMFGQDLQAAQYNGQRINDWFSRASGAVSSQLGAQAQDYGQKQGNQQNDFTQGMALAQFGSAQDQYSYQAETAQRLQALNELLTKRQTPMNEISSLMGGSQVSRPSWTATPTASIQPADLTGMVSNNYKTAMSGYTGMLGGLASLGGSIASAGFAKSDERLKHDIRELGRLPSGLGVYSYRFADGRAEIGLLAQEVLLHRPDAVRIDDDGFFSVHYGRALEAA